MKKERKHERFRVNLQVKFSSALDFVTQYADNISAGGLFVRGKIDAEPLSHVPVEVILPGHGSFMIKARVAHIMTEEMAAKFGCGPGAGMEIVEAPSDFQSALSNYLMVLGNRRGSLIWVNEKSLCDELGVAGYDAEHYKEGNMTGSPLAFVTIDTWNKSLEGNPPIIQVKNFDDAIAKVDALLLPS